MGKIVISENVTLDGVVQDPTGDEGFRHGGWSSRIGDYDRAEWAKVLLDEALRAEALLLGRRSDEWFAARWLSRSGPWADRLNSMPKYVVSSAPGEPRWGNATVLTGDVVAEVFKLKQRLDGDIVVYGSTQLVPTLIEHDLADELRLFIYPVVLGSGRRLFGEVTQAKPMRLVQAQNVGDGLALLSYQRGLAPAAGNRTRWATPGQVRLSTWCTSPQGTPSAAWWSRMACSSRPSSRQ